MIISIVIKTLSGNVFCVNKQSTDTIQSLKEEIEKCSGIPSDNQRLIFEGKQLTDTTSLAFNNIEEGSSLTLIQVSKPLSKCRQCFLTLQSTHEAYRDALKIFSSVSDFKNLCINVYNEFERRFSEHIGSNGYCDAAGIALYQEVEVQMDAIYVAAKAAFEAYTVWRTQCFSFIEAVCERIGVTAIRYVEVYADHDRYHGDASNSICPTEMAKIHEWFYGEATTLIASAQKDIRNRCYNYSEFERKFNENFVAQKAIIDARTTYPYLDSFWVWSPLPLVGSLLWVAHVVAVARSTAYSASSSIVLAAVTAAESSNEDNDVDVLGNAQANSEYFPFNEVLLELCGDIVPTAGTWTSHSGHTVTDLFDGDLVTSLKSEFFEEIKYLYEYEGDEGYFRIDEPDRFHVILHRFFRVYQKFKVGDYSRTMVL